MAIKFGEIDAGQILENEFRIGVLERTLNTLLARNIGRLVPVTAEEVEQFRRDVIADLQKKYPKTSINYKPAVRAAE